MPQSLAKIYVHLVFSTKNRERVLPDEIRADLSRLFRRHAQRPWLLAHRNQHRTRPRTSVVRDDAHATLSNVVGQVKKSAKDWLRARGPQFANFYWQGGCGAFSASQSAVEEVRAYIRNQREHHQRVSFQDELRTFLKRYEVEFVEQ